MKKGRRMDCIGYRSGAGAEPEEAEEAEEEGRWEGEVEDEDKGGLHGQGKM